MQKLTADQKKTLTAQIRALDAKGEIVSLTPGPDFKGGTIIYNRDSGIIFGEAAFKLTDEDMFVPG